MTEEHCKDCRGFGFIERRVGGGHLRKFKCTTCGGRDTIHTHDDTDAAFYGRVYDLLVERAGAPNGKWDKKTFVEAYTAKRHKATEYRCCGAFGFGGKFWRNPGGGHNGCGFYVSCYPEDRKHHKQFGPQIDQINAEIAKLVAEMRPAPDGPV